MPANPREQKQLLDLLAHEGSCDLTKVSEIFFGGGKKPNLQTAVTALRTLQGDKVFEVVDTNDSEGGDISIRQELFKEPDRYRLKLLDFLDNDVNISSMYELAVEDETVEIEPGLCIAVLKDYQGVEVAGDPIECANTYERLRAFTLYFANLLVKHDFEAAAQKFSSRVSDKFTAQWLQEKCSSAEKSYGQFDYFDHLRIFRVYAGAGSDKKYFEDMPLPKGVSRADRIGESSFKLISVYSPNGIAIYDYSVRIFVIEENGSLKICDCKWFSGN